jgi:hypothetical protein
VRIRSAVSIVVSVVVAKTVLTWAALNMWVAFQDRPLHPSRPWRIDLGHLADWAAAVGTFVAAIVAPGIASGDRRLRSSERLNESKIHARLVQVTAEPQSGSRSSVLR